MLKLLVFVLSSVSAANILCIFPTPAYSHQSVFAAYVDYIAAAGHNVTVITPMPRGVQYVLEIDCSKPTLLNERANYADESTVTAINYTPLIDMVYNQMKNKNVTDILQNNGIKFDLIVCEAYLSILLMFGFLYNAPIIRLSSGHGTNENFAAMNKNVLYNASVHPNVWRSNFNLSHSEAALTEEKLSNEWELLEQIQENRINQFGSQIPPLKELKKKIVLTFINVSPAFDNNRPVSENVQYLGGLHLKHPRYIRDNTLKRFINQHNKILYMSFGSILNVSMFNTTIVNKIISMFSKLPYNILWRVDESIHQHYNVPSNVYTSNWFPQRDVLNHLNIKLFITQGGVQSIDEAIDSGVPMLCIPIAGDQFYNSYKIKQLRMGETASLLHLEEIDKLIIHMMNNSEMYIANIHDHKKLISDTLVGSLEKSLWYTNRVLRLGRLLL